jgi:hypothetical protein
MEKIPVMGVLTEAQGVPQTIHLNYPFAPHHFTHFH